MSHLNDFIDNWPDFRRQFGNELRLGGCVLALVLISAVMASGGPEPAPAPPQAKRNPMELIASPNEPFMTEAIQITINSRSSGEPWKADPVLRGPTATFQSPGGPITLTAEEIANANQFYVQIKDNPAILRSNSASRSSSQSGSFSDDLSGDW
jgi:hypothetical protein